jgi:Papain family cysteine protease
MKTANFAGRVSAGSRIFPTNAIIFTPHRWQNSVRSRRGPICANIARPFITRDKSAPAPPTPLPPRSSSIAANKSFPTSFPRASSFITMNEAWSGAYRWITAHKFATGIKTVGKQGACPEKEWPYDDTPADPNTNVWPAGAKPAQKPPRICFTDAKKFRALSYQRVNRTLSQMKGCLADGYPFVFGFTVYDCFESAEMAKTGMLEMPTPGEGSIGGHAVLAVGYDDKAQRFMIRNSWGAKWGIKGYFTMPYSYLLTENLSDDFWTIRLVH